MNEVVNVLQQYFSDESGNEVHYCGSPDAVQWFSDMLYSGHTIENEAPDFVIEKGNDILLIEHFEFDSYPSNNGGSKSRSEQARIDRVQEALPATEKGTVFNEVIHGNSTYENYCRNAIKIFDKHYGKIQQYRENVVNKRIAKPEQSIRVMFLIDDTSPIGSMASDKSGNLHAVTLACSKRFLDHLHYANNLDYVLCTLSAGNQKIIWFINLLELVEYEKVIDDYDNMQFFGQNPHVIGAKIVIPDTKKQEE